MNIFTAENNKVIIEAVIDDIIKKSSTNLNENFVVIVPEKFSVTIERLLLLKSTRKALINVQVVTLSRLLHKLLNKEHNFISKQTGVMLTKKIIIDNYDSLVCYKKTAKTTGFAENIYDTISELKNSNVTPNEYGKNVKSGLTSALNLKLKDIFLIYSEYEKALKKFAFVDAADRFSLLSSLILNSDYIKHSNVYTLGFDSTSPSGKVVFEALAKTSKSITFSCIDNQGKNNSYILKPEMKEVYFSVANSIGINPNVFYFTNNTGKVQAHIINNLYAYPYSKMQIGLEVQLLSASSLAQEVELLSQQIRHRVVKDKLRYKDVCVLLTNFDLYKNIVKETFLRYDIPCFFDQSEKIKDHPVIGFILAVINTVRKNYTVEDYIEVLHSEFSGLTTYEQSNLENFIIKYGINYDKLNKSFDFKFRREEDNDFQQNVELSRKKLSDKLNVLSADLPSVKCATAFLEFIKKIIELFNLENALTEFSSKLALNNDLEKAEVTKQVLPKLISLAEEMSRILNDTNLDIDELYSIFASGIESETVSLIPVSVDRVFVGDISTSKFFTSKDLYVIGANDGALPQVKDDCGIIVDKELNMLSMGLGKQIEPTIKTINQREKYKVINALSEFVDRLVISYSCIGPSGEEQMPSSAMREISKIFYTKDRNAGLEIISEDSIRKFRELLSEKDKAESYASLFATKAVSKTKLLKKAKSIFTADTIMLPSEKKAYYSLLEVLSKLSGKSEEDFVKELFTSRKEQDLKNAKDLYFKDNKVGITELECYFSCPFKHFATYGLKIKPREDARLGSTDYGNVLHKIAELYMKNIEHYEKMDIRSVKDKQKEIEKMILFVLNQEKLQMASNKHMVMLLLEEAKRLIDALTYEYRLTKFRPIGAEVKFGEGGDLPAVKLDSGIRIEGKIDRVDKADGFFRVIDYKTGHIDITPKMTYYGLKLQLFNYLNAIKGFKGLKPVGAFYLPIKNVFVEGKLDKYDFSSYKLVGVYANNQDVIRALDTSLSVENAKSDVCSISVSTAKEYKETGELVPTGAGAITEDVLNGILDYEKKVASVATEEIMEGYIKPSPMEDGGRTPCEFCEYKYICGRDFNTSVDIRKPKSGIKYENFYSQENLKNDKK